MIISNHAQSIMFHALAGSISHLIIYDNETVLAVLDLSAQVTDRLTLSAGTAQALATGTATHCELVDADDKILIRFESGQFDLPSTYIGGDVSVAQFEIDF